MRGKCSDDPYQDIVCSAGRYSHYGRPVGKSIANTMVAVVFFCFFRDRLIKIPIRNLRNENFSHIPESYRYGYHHCCDQQKGQRLVTKLIGEILDSPVGPSY